MRLKKLYSFIMVTAFCLIQLCNAHAAPTFSAEQLKKMSVFISNFTELGFTDISAQKFLNPSQPADMVHFGIWHNYINNYKSLIKKCPQPNCQWGSAVISTSAVKNSLKRYFDYDMQSFPSVHTKFANYHCDGTYYHFEPADGEQCIYARVEKAEQGPDGVITMSGKLYNAEDENEITGSFKATAKPHIWKNKNTWALLQLQCSSQQQPPNVIIIGLNSLHRHAAYAGE